MGLQLKNLVKTKELEFLELNNKVLAVDTFNLLYQFLTTIRQSDGSPLKDSNGNITSHLVGLFNRTINLMQKNIKLVFVFDGDAPDLKKEERERRAKLKEEAGKLYEVAKQQQDIEGMKKYAARTTRLTKNMIDEAKELITALGLPYVQAPSEGEAQAAHMVKRGDCFAAVSQDFDTLMFGAPRLVRNLTISGKKKKANSPVYMTLKPEILTLKSILDAAEITNDQLIIIGILIGTDFNKGGIKGIGPAKALKLVKEYKDNYDELFTNVKWDEFFEFPWKLVYDTINDIPVDDSYELNFKSVNREAVIELMHKKHDVSIERLNIQLDRLEKSVSGKAQKGLSDFF